VKLFSFVFASAMCSCMGVWGDLAVPLCYIHTFRLKQSQPFRNLLPDMASEKVNMLTHGPRIRPFLRGEVQRLQPIMRDERPKHIRLDETTSQHPEHVPMVQMDGCEQLGEVGLVVAGLQQIVPLQIERLSGLGVGREVEFGYQHAGWSENVPDIAIYWRTYCGSMKL